jgi:hypothetical protein
MPRLRSGAAARRRRQGPARRSPPLVRGGTDPSTRRRRPGAPRDYGLAEEPDVLDGRLSAARLRANVIVLDPVPRAADAPVLEPPRAAPAVPRPHRALHRCECESASRAASSFSLRRFGTVRCIRNRSPVSGSNDAPRGRTSGAFTDCAGTLASRRSAGQPVDVVLGSDGADAEEPVSAATRGGVEAAVERTGTIIVRAGGRSAGISSATSSRASSLDRWKNRGSFSARFSGPSPPASRRERKDVQLR